MTRQPIADNTLAMDAKRADSLDRAGYPNELRLSRTYLDSVTTDELIKMADSLGIDIPPELDRIFIMEELLDFAGSDDAGRGAADGSDSFDTDPSPSPNSDMDRDDSNAGLIETVPLPKQYSITFVELMIRDPLWAFVFWEIKTQDREQIEKNQDFEGYYLKVSSLGDDCNGHRDFNSGQPPPIAEDVFTISVAPSDSAWYLGFTPDREGLSGAGKNKYKVDLCARIKGEELVLASSNPFILPGLYDPAAVKCKQEQDMYNNPLVRLSGYGDFHILHYSERLFRARKDGSIGSI